MTSMFRSINLPKSGFVAPFEHQLDQQQRGRPLHGLMNIAQDPQAIGVVPIVDHGREDVGVGARGHGGEEVAADCLAAVGDALFGEVAAASGP